VRVLGSQLYYLKRILLWSPETQPGAITRESGSRTEMVQAQLKRETARKTLSHEEFLQTLQLRVSVSVLRSSRNLHMSRALELLNKTNQFNTTGARYTLAQCHQLLGEGQQLLVVEVSDRFTSYGLVGVAWLRGNCLEQFALSCRALGLGVEDALLACVAGMLAREGHGAMLGRLQPTDANFACRQLFGRNGFARTKAEPNLWTRPLAAVPAIPAHVSMTISGEACDSTSKGESRPQEVELATADS